MKKQIFLIAIASLAGCFVSMAGELYRSAPSDTYISGSVQDDAPANMEYHAGSVEELQNLMPELQAGSLVLLADGDYKDVKLIVSASGTGETPILIRAEHPGKVKFCGDAKVELRGDYVSFSGVLFTDGDRKPEEWKSHGPGLVAIYGSHCEVYDCLFHNFDRIPSAYITTSLDENGKVPQYCHIHHCAFIEKTTLDQVINLNNTKVKSLEGTPGIPMYHRVDHCFFSNPKKKGNAGGGIRVGYWRKDYGRCLIDHNLFERQDSEAEIITSKSMENVYYNNTFMNCQGTMNFRHGDHQVAINNYFIGTDEKYEYGGMFIWGSDHIVGANYFSLPRPPVRRGKAAITFNSGKAGTEHALAFNVWVVNNNFINIDGNVFNGSALLESRTTFFGEGNVEYPRDLHIIHNRMFSEDGKQYLFEAPLSVVTGQEWEENRYYGMAEGCVPEMEGMILTPEATLRYDDSKINIEDIDSRMDMETLRKILPYDHIEGIDLDFAEIISHGHSGSPMNRSDVGPSWCKKLPGTYMDTGIWNKKITNK